MVDLTAAVQAAGLAFTSNFQIKFQQYGNFSWPGDGTEFDNIQVILNNDNDDLPDYWEIEHFGRVDHPNATGSANPDGDLHDNAFEAVAGLDPNDLSSQFTMTVDYSEAEESTTVTFGPIVEVREYILHKSNDLKSWQDVTPDPEDVQDAGEMRSVTLHGASDGDLYQVKIRRQ